MIVAEYCKCPRCGNKKASKISWSGIVVCDKCGYNSTQNKKETKMSDKDSIKSVFVKQFEADVHTAYQQMGTKLRATVRSKSGVVSASTTFQKVGRGTASTKSRHGIVPVMNLNHEPVECLLQDYYAGDWVDALDELKTNIDERRVVASAGAYALGRKTDELIIAAMQKCTHEVKDETDDIKPTIMSMISTLNEYQVPDDGRRYCIMNSTDWNRLQKIDNIMDHAEHGSTAINYLGVIFMLHNGVDRIYMYHASAIGHACGQEVKTDISWHGERQAHFICNSMSQGACLIDDEGVVKSK